MIQSNKDLHQKINKIIEVLKFSGTSEPSGKLYDALSISTIPSEILSESKLVLIKINKTNLPKKLDIKNEVDESLKYLDKILK